MEKKITTINDFYDVARNNEYFLWHFLQKNQEKGSLDIQSYYFETTKSNDNKLKEIIDLVNIPYFESYTEDSIDFLHEVAGFDYNQIWNKKGLTRDVSFNPVLIGFNKFKNVSSTFKKCYCSEGILKVILELNPEFLTTIDTED
jgi:hypothetical protein